MNKQVLRDTRDNLIREIMRCKTETVHLDRRMEIIMAALASICAGLVDEEPKRRELEIIDVEEGQVIPKS
jgi:hypothetical protein